MKILITGAHFTPAAAVIEELKKYPNIKITYVGRRTTQEGDNTQSVESKVLPSLGVKFIPIITGRLQRTFTIYTFFSLLKIPLGFIQAIFILLIERPNVILSFGGYVAVPTVICGWLLSIPIIIHEQTLVSGLANSISSFFADKIAYSFENKNNISEKNIYTGNPIRKEIINSHATLPAEYGNLFSDAKKNKRPVILFTAGNQGSHLINLTVEKAYKDVGKTANIILITGDNKFKDFERISSLDIPSDKLILKKWIGQEYGTLLRKVDLIVCRAGANTLTELAFLGKNALVIPIPYLYKDEQNVNAHFFNKLGLVEILPQSKLSAKSLVESIKDILGRIDKLNKKAKFAKKIINLDASKRLALETTLLAKGI